MSYLLLVFVSLCLTCEAQRITSHKTQRTEVFFSPKGGCTDAITREIARATNSIHIQAYSFTSAPIAQALVATYRRGIKVNIILDKSQKTEKYSSATFLLNSGIKPLIDDNHAIAHNKVMIIDNKTVITGSFNFTKAAEEKNAENILIIESPSLATEYLKNWNAHAKHSVPYSRESR